MKYINKILIIPLLITVACQIKKETIVRDKELIIYKFLYNADYPFPQTEESFWINGHDFEFATYKKSGLDEKQLLDFIHLQKPAPPENDPKSKFWYKYAFVFPSGDTIYSNERLDQWKVKRNGKAEYYSGPDTNSPEVNKEFCVFFSLNNFFSKTVYTKFPLEEDNQK